MPVLYLTCRRPFDRRNLSVNSQIREKIRDFITSWTGWNGPPNDVRWRLRIENVHVTDRDVVVYFVWNYNHGLVRHRLTQGITNLRTQISRLRVRADGATSQRNRQELEEELEEKQQELNALEAARTQFIGEALARVSHYGLTVPETPAISEVWMEQVLQSEFGFGAHSPNWTPGAIDRAAQIWAATALHEAAHNKVEPVKRRRNRQWDLHSQGGGGIFAGIRAGSAPNPRNLALLRDHIWTRRSQYVTAHPDFGGDP